MSHLLQLGLANAIAAALLAAAVAAPAFVLRRRYPAVVHALWLLVLLKLVTPPLWKIPVSWQQPARDGTRAGAVETVGAATEESAEERVASGETEIVDTPVLVPPPEPESDWAAVAVWSVGAVWVGGSLACLALIVTRSVRFRRLLRHAEPVPADVRRRATHIASRFGLRECPGVWFVPGAVCPMLWALGPDARLLLPRGLWDRLDDGQRETPVAPELAHLRRRDHWVRLIEVAVTVLYWWNPVLWWARRGLREAEEQCCDAWVVWSMPAGVRHYMGAFLGGVEFFSHPTPGGAPPPPAVPALASGM